MKKNYLSLILLLFACWISTKATTTERGFIGIMPSAYADQLLGYGTPIDRVMDNSPAQNAGLRRGDVITAVNGHLLNGGCDIMTFISAHHTDELVHINYVREGKPAEVDVVLSPKTFTSTTVYVMDKVLGQNHTWRFRDDNSIVTITDEKNAIFSKEVGGNTRTFAINFDNVLVGDVKYFALKDKIELIKYMIENQKGGESSLFDSEGTTKMINFVLSLDAITQIPTISVNTLDIISKNKKEEFNQEIILDVNELNIYPNPNHGIFNINLLTAEKGKATISVLDVEGKIVFIENINNFSGTYTGSVNLTGAAAGFYTVSIKVGDKQLFRKINIDN